MMKEIKVSSFKQVKDIVSAAASCECELNVQDLKGVIADAKSILGLMNLDYKHPVKLMGESAEEVERPPRGGVKKERKGRRRGRSTGRLFLCRFCLEERGVNLYRP